MKGRAFMVKIGWPASMFFFFALLLMAFIPSNAAAQAAVEYGGIVGSKPPPRSPEVPEKPRTIDKTRFLSILCAEEEKAQSGEGGRQDRRALDHREARCPIRENPLTRMMGLRV